MRPQQFDLDPSLTSGHPALEFTNSVSNHASGHPADRLPGYENLLELTERIKLLGPGQVRGLKRKAQRQPGEAAAVLAQAIRLREAVYRIFVALTEGASPAEADLAVLNKLLGRATAAARLSRRAGGFEWDWNVDETALDAPVHLMALAAVDLLTSENCGRVGQCADEDGCGWLFVDTSRNHSRRWCDINDCGNRAKQRRFQQRARKAK
jgi:predicted RNA-binding Zn ribbon-like protein